VKGDSRMVSRIEPPRFGTLRHARDGSGHGSRDDREWRHAVCHAGLRHRGEIVERAIDQRTEKRTDQHIEQRTDRRIEQRIEQRIEEHSRPAILGMHTKRFVVLRAILANFVPRSLISVSSGVSSGGGSSGGSGGRGGL